MMKPPDSPPSWYCNFKVPEDSLTTFQPIVYLVGLDIQSHHVHRSFWEVLSLKNPGRDFQPKYVNVSLDHKLRDKKVKMPESMEYYVPRGILKTNWVHKHTNDIPSAVVTFFDMNWSDPQWNERKMELARQIKILKTNLAPHGTQILVMLMKPAGISDDNFTTERASAFCAATEIPPKHLFVLAHTNNERIQACVQRLEIGMRENSKAYYLSRIKKVIGWKDKVTVTPLLVRYNFKIGFFQEIRKDFIGALKNYQSAFDALLTIKATDANVQELKVVASVLTYRMCRIHLNKGDGNEAKNQFNKLIRSFLKIEGNKDLLFEHFAWLSSQYLQFAELLKEYYRTNASNIPDPVSYYISAGNCAVKRRGAFNQSVENMGKPTWPSEMNPYNGSVPVKLHCIGQRPWWNNPFSQDYLYAIEDANTIMALKYFESLVKHSDNIISDWGIASEVCRDTQRTRCRCQLMRKMAAEVLTTKQYNKCIVLMTHVLREIGQEDWTNIVTDVANCGIEAAYAAGDSPAYCNFLMVLLKLDTFLSQEKQSLLWANFESVINGKPPVSLKENGDFDRIAWEKSLAEGSEWTSYVEIHTQPILECRAFFLEEVASALEKTKIRLVLTNKSAFTITVQKYGVRMNPSDYNCESSTSLTLNPSERQELELFLKPTIRDISKSIQIQVAYVDIGRPGRSVLLHYALLKSNSYLWLEKKDTDTAAVGHNFPKLLDFKFRTNNIWGTKKDEVSAVRVEQAKSPIKIDTNTSGPILLDEWYKLKVSLTNTDTNNYDRISFACHLQTPDPLSAVLCADPKNATTPSLNYISDSSSLAAGESADIILYLRTNVQDIKLFTKLKCTDPYGQAMTSEVLRELKVVHPFESAQVMTNVHNVPVESVSASEDVKVSVSLTNISDVKLRIKNMSFHVTSPFQLLDESSHKRKDDMILSPLEEAGCTALLSSPELGTKSPGVLEVVWMREPSDSTYESVSRIPVLLIPVLADNSLYLKASFSNNGHGKLKSPMTGLYTLFNCSNAVFDLTILMDSTESFMNAGPKRISVKLYGKEKYTFNYILFPLVTGLVETPKLSVFTPSNGATILEPIELTVHQNAPKTLYITA